LDNGEDIGEGHHQQHHAGRQQRRRTVFEDHERPVKMRFRLEEREGDGQE
jgi:hypothetical protein